MSIPSEKLFLLCGPTVETSRRVSTDTISENTPYFVYGWEKETDLGNPDDREDVYYLTIATEDGEEVCTVIHRATDQYPIDGEEAQRKLQVANQIAKALNLMHRLEDSEI